MVAKKTKKEEDGFQVDFDMAWEYYWYKLKPFHKRLTDSYSEELEVCAKFFETLNNLGLLDKCYNKQIVKR